MRTTINIDDDLLAETQRVTGVVERVTLVREGLRALIERESACRLAKLGALSPNSMIFRGVNPTRTHDTGRHFRLG